MYMAKTYPRKINEKELRQKMFLTKMMFFEKKFRENPELLDDVKYKSIFYINPKDPEQVARAVVLEEREQLKKQNLSLDLLKSEPVKIDPVVSFALAYETVLGKYSHKPTLTWVNSNTKLDPKSIIYYQFKMAAQIADELNANYEQFCWAIFYFYHKFFARAPKPYEMRIQTGKMSVKDRYLEYMSLKNAGKIDTVTESPVLPYRELTFEELDKHNRKTLKQLMEAWNMAEWQVYDTFSADGIFDLKWLKKQPIYLSYRKTIIKLQSQTSSPTKAKN